MTLDCAPSRANRVRGKVASSPTDRKPSCRKTAIYGSATQLKQWREYRLTESQLWMPFLFYRKAMMVYYHILICHFRNKSQHKLSILTSLLLDISKLCCKLCYSERLPVQFLSCPLFTLTSNARLYRSKKPPSLPRQHC